MMKRRLTFTINPFKSPVTTRRDTLAVFFPEGATRHTTGWKRECLGMRADLLQCFLKEHQKNCCTTRLEMLCKVTYVDYF